MSIPAILSEIASLLFSSDYSLRSRTTNEIGFSIVEDNELKFFLIIALLIYVYGEDDNNFSKKEQRQVLKILRSTKRFVSRESRKELRNMTVNRVYYFQLLKLLDDYNMKSHDVKEAVKIIEFKLPDLIENEKYFHILSEVQVDLLAVLKEKELH